MEAGELQAVEQLKEGRATIRKELSKVIIGQNEVVDQTLISIFTRSHSLLVGVPGLAKTLLVSSLAETLDLDFKRIQFTPDLMPSDITGTEVIFQDPGTNEREFKFLKGPIFSNIVLADEINRTPPKTQAAMLEAMQERKISIGGQDHDLPDPFFVLATQNPIEQEGTYPLPEAQLDRFLIYVRIDYPALKDEHAILNTVREEARQEFTERETNIEPVSQNSVLSARREILDMHMAPTLESYIVQLVGATRDPANYDKDLAQWVRFGASPRATIAMDSCSRAHAWLDGRDYVNPEDIQAIAHDVLRHRVLLSFEAEADGITSDQFISELL